MAVDIARTSVSFKVIGSRGRGLNQDLFEIQPPQVAVAADDADDLERPGVGAINDQIGIDGPDTIIGTEFFAGVAEAGC
jgi:hypothetical protein